MTQANIDVGSVDVDAIVSGTSTVGISGANGNTFMTVGGTANVLVASTTGVVVTGTMSATGNVTGGNILTGGLIDAAGGIGGGNLFTSGQVSAAGNITGSYILGNGSQLTGIDATSIQNGTSNVKVVSSGGNVTVGIANTSNVVVVSTTGVAVTGTMSATGNTTGGNLLTGGLISATGAMLTYGTPDAATWCDILGGTKPKLVLKNNRWYLYMIEIVISFVKLNNESYFIYKLMLCSTNRICCLPGFGFHKVSVFCTFV